MSLQSTKTMYIVWCLTCAVVVVGVEVLAVDGYRVDEEGYWLQKRSLIGDKAWGKRDVGQREMTDDKILNWKQMIGNELKRTLDIIHGNLNYKELDEIDKRAMIGGGRWGKRFANTLLLRNRLMGRNWGKRSSGPVVNLRKRPRPLRLG